MTPVPHMQEAMPQILMRTNSRTEQGIIIIIRRKVLEEAQGDLHQKEKMHQEKEVNYPVEYARKIHTQDFLDVQNSRSIYQENRTEQVAYPRKYASSASEPYLMSADTPVCRLTKNIAARNLMSSS